MTTTSGEPSGYPPCSRTCLGGIQETLLECIYKQNGSAVSADLCIESAQLPIQRQMCNDFPCPTRWRIGDFDQCSATCGNGMMTREVDCIQEFAPGPDNFLSLPDFMCEKPTPQRERHCRIRECPSQWKTGPWSQCSVTCGEGYSLRPSFCQKKKPNGRSKNVSASLCSEETKPITERLCNLTDCPEPKIHKADALFFQLRKVSKVRLMVGMEAAILPGTTVVARCPTRGISHRDIFWRKDGGPLKVSKRVTASKRGNLRIRRTRPRKDTGTYTCNAGGLTENITIFFSNVLDLLHAERIRDEYISQNSSQYSDSIQNETRAMHLDPVDKTMKPLRHVLTNWSPCSVSCGGGVRTRNVSCEIVTPSYYEHFPSVVCQQAGMETPPLVESCNIQGCLRWNVSDWTECSSGECQGNGLAQQNRNVQCIDATNSIVVNETECLDTGSQPVSLRNCYTSNCSAIWNTSDWTQCSGECGERGYQVRMISCIWARSGIPAGRSCLRIPRPKTRRKCRSNPCPKYCLDESHHCRIVKLMKLCRYGDFRKKCCNTCTRHKHDS
ncbi:hypothetical protein ScPMuIL_018415 [Solemya velum]